MSLTTHVLDTMRGGGAAGMRVVLRRGDADCADVTLDEGGRATLLNELQDGAYEIQFHAGAYQGGAAFYDVIPVRFAVADATRHCHIPLVLAPFGYSTYRGG